MSEQTPADVAAENEVLVTLGKVRTVVTELSEVVAYHRSREGVTPEIRTSRGWVDLDYYVRTLVDLTTPPDSSG